DVDAALVDQQALEAVAHVLGSELPAVHGGLRVETHALLELEDVGRVVGLLPRLREIALDLKRARPDGRARLVAEESAVREADDHVRLVRVGEHVVEMRRIPCAKRQRAAALRRLCGGARGERRGGEAARTDRQQLSPGEQVLSPGRPRWAGGWMRGDPVA